MSGNGSEKPGPAGYELREVSAGSLVWVSVDAPARYLCPRCWETDGEERALLATPLGRVIELYCWQCATPYAMEPR